MRHCKSPSWANEGGDNLFFERYLLNRDEEEGGQCSGSGCHADGCGNCSEESEEGDADERLDERMSAKNDPVDEIVFGDNGSALFERFRIDLDPSHKKYAGGYQWFCRQCGQPCTSSETWFPCKGKFITTKVICHLGCHNHWRLHICPPAGQVRLNS